MISGVNKDFHYNYLEGTSLLESLAHPNGISTERSYETQRNLITDINDMPEAIGVSLRAYSYDALGRPVTRKISRNDSARDDNFEYNSRSELIASNHDKDNFPSGAPHSPTRADWVPPQKSLRGSEANCLRLRQHRQSHNGTGTRQLSHLRHQRSQSV